MPRAATGALLARSASQHPPHPSIPSLAANPMPTMPEEQPFGEASTSFFGGASTVGSSSTSYSAAGPLRGADATSPAGGAGVEFGSGYAREGSLSPVARQDSFSAATGRTGEGHCHAFAVWFARRRLCMAGRSSHSMQFLLHRSKPPASSPHLPDARRRLNVGVPPPARRQLPGWAACCYIARKRRLLTSSPSADSMWASRPLRADSSLAQRPASDSYYPEEPAAAASPTGGSVWRQGSNAPGSAAPR